jgi:hypothetical protein
MQRMPASQPLLAESSVEHARLRSADFTLGGAVLDCHAVHEQPMHGAVARDKATASQPNQRPPARRLIR